MLILTVGGGRGEIYSARVWHNDVRPPSASCFDCSTLVSPSFPASREDMLLATMLVTSASRPAAGDHLAVEVNHVGLRREEGECGPRTKSGKTAGAM